MNATLSPPPKKVIPIEVGLFRLSDGAVIVAPFIGTITPDGNFSKTELNPNADLSEVRELLSYVLDRLRNPQQ